MASKGIQLQDSVAHGRVTGSRRQCAFGTPGTAGLRSVLTLLAVSACSRSPERVVSVVSGTPSEDAVAAAATISDSDMRTRIGIISHDSMGGRPTPSPGLDMTAAYIAGEFARLQLEPAGGTSGFIQEYQPVEGGMSAPNVVAVLRGSDPLLRESFVVFSAHMDHIGIGTPDINGDSIYNGADDDASGTSAIIEIAEAFASLPAPPARSVAFVTVSGEENGLLGSKAFVKGGTVPVASMVADINIDMIGRNSPDTVVAIGLRYSSLGETLHRVAAARSELGLAVVDDPWPEEGFFFRSDHYNFAQAGVPAVFFFAGVHGDYHRPSDEVDRIDAVKAARIARLAFWLGLDIANDGSPPAWTPEGLSEVRPRRN